MPKGILVAQDIGDCGGILFAKAYDNPMELRSAMMDELLRLSDDYDNAPVTIENYRDNYGEWVMEATYNKGEKMLYKIFWEQEDL